MFCLVNLADVSSPLPVMVLSASLKKRGVDVCAVDLSPFFHEKSERFFDVSVQKLLDTKCSVFGFSCICTNLPVALILARKLKETDPNFKIVFGGCQPSLVSRELMERYDFVDVTVIGEGDVTLPVLLLTDFDPEKLKAVNGIVFRTHIRAGTEPRPYVTQPAGMIHDLDTLPYPDLTIVDTKNLSNEKNYFPIEAGRGCPCACTYCSTSVMWQKKFRVKSPKRIFLEMEQAYQKIGVVKFNLTHDYFTFSKKYLTEFCDYFKEHNTHFSWTASSRIDCLDDKTIKMMSAAGCNGVFLGIESGAKRIQKIIKKDLNLENYENVLNACKKHGLVIDASFIIGFPEEEKNDLNATLGLMLKFKQNGAYVFCSKLSPLAGTFYYKKFKNSLISSPYIPLAATMPFKSQLVENEISKFPTLFSSYYSVPHPKFSDEFISGIGFFFTTIINAFPETVQALMDATHASPCEVYGDWTAWRMKDHGDKDFSAEFVTSTFLEFVKQLSLFK